MIERMIYSVAAVIAMDNRSIGKNYHAPPET
jgi:hypothetical protein